VLTPQGMKRLSKFERVRHIEQPYNWSMTRLRFPSTSRLGATVRSWGAGRNEWDLGVPAIDEFEDASGVEMLLDSVGEAVEHVTATGTEARCILGRFPSDPRLPGDLGQPRPAECVVLEESVTGGTPGGVESHSIEKGLDESSPGVVGIEEGAAVVDLVRLDWITSPRT